MSNIAKIQHEILTIRVEPPRDSNLNGAEVTNGLGSATPYVGHSRMGKVKSNCILFALRRWFSRGGYIVLRKSNYGWWPHMIWTKDFVTFEEFTPPVHYARVFPPLVFEGIIKTTNRTEQVAKARVAVAAGASRT
jgi:hypothetical protein